MDFFVVRDAPRTPKNQPKNDRTAAMHRFSGINPQMMQQVLSIQGLSNERKSESTHGKRHYAELSVDSEALCTHKDSVESLPRQSTIASSGPVAKPYCLPSQLTIFYKGTVNVYDITAKKAQAIMTLAGNLMGSPHQCLTADPTTVASSRSLSSLRKSALHHMACVDLPIARQKSLQRFLEKRNDRLNSAAPYRRAQLAKDGFCTKDKISSA